MHLLKALSVILFAAGSNAAAVYVEASATSAEITYTSTPTEPTTESEQRLFKRRVIETTKEVPLSTPPPWIRTISSTKLQAVTPVIVGGVTFSARPKDVKTPVPWLSVEANGYLKTIVPKVKNGVTQNASPDYGNYFDYPVTSKVEVDGETHNNIKFHSEENHEDRLLNPIMRCTPDRYAVKKIDGNKVTFKPFCSPVERTNIIVGEVHWITWYTRYFSDIKKVRLHMAYIESSNSKKKRDTESSIEEDTFFTTEWLDNLDGVYPLEITADDLLGQPIQEVILSIQPDNISDEDFNLVNGTRLTLRRYPLKGKKLKKLKLDNKKDDSALYVALTIPTILVVVLCGYMIVNWTFRNNRTWKKIKIRSRRNFNNSRYTALPTNTYELQNRG